MIGRLTRAMDYSHELETNLDSARALRIARDLAASGEAFAGYSVSFDGTTDDCVFAIRKLGRTVSRFEVWASRDLAELVPGGATGRRVVTVEWQSTSFDALLKSSSWRVAVSAATGVPGQKAMEQFAARYELALRAADPSVTSPCTAWTDSKPTN